MWLLRPHRDHQPQSPGSTKLSMCHRTRQGWPPVCLPGESHSCQLGVFSRVTAGLIWVVLPDFQGFLEGLDRSPSFTVFMGLLCWNFNSDFRWTFGKFLLNSTNLKKKTLYLLNSTFLTQWKFLPLPLETASAVHEICDISLPNLFHLYIEKKKTPTELIH